MKNTMLHSKLTICSLAIMVVAMAVCIPLFESGPVAHAAGIANWQSTLWPNNDTYPDVISDCNGQSAHGGVAPDQCIFHITGHQVVSQPPTRVSIILSQCKQTTSSTLSINWNYTSTTSFTQGETFTVGSSLADAVGSSISASTSISWSLTNEQSVSSGGSFSVVVPANNDGWVNFAPQVDVYSGWLEIHYPKRLFGHYIWYYPYQNASTFQVTSPSLDSNNRQLGVLTAATQPCGNHK